MENEIIMCNCKQYAWKSKSGISNEMELYKYFDEFLIHRINNVYLTMVGLCASLILHILNLIQMKIECKHVTYELVNTENIWVKN